MLRIVFDAWHYVVACSFINSIPFYVLRTIIYIREGCGGRRPQPPVRPASAGAYGSEADPGASPTAPCHFERGQVTWFGAARPKKISYWSILPKLTDRSSLPERFRPQPQRLNIWVINVKMPCLQAIEPVEPCFFCRIAHYPLGTSAFSPILYP